MSCPDWKRLVHDREAEEWREALDHLDSGCPLCRRAAFALDPLLAFRQLPAVEMSAESEAREIEDMQRAVAAMRTASRLETPVRGAVHWRRWAAAAGLTILALSAGPWRAPAGRPEARDARAAGAPPALPARLGNETNIVEAVENRPEARVYQMDGDGITVAMIVDESLEL